MANITTMSRARHPIALALGSLGGALALAGCGSGATQTVSVSNSGPASTGASQAHTTGVRTPAATATSGGRAAAGRTGGAPSSPSRAAPRPAFAQPAGGDEGLRAALATVRAHGFAASDASQYHSDQTLRVLVGTRAGSGDGGDQQAFFFVNGRYIGTDAREPSASLRVVSQDDTEVALAYSLYRPGDPACCPGGGQANVRFQLDNGRLVALGPIPPVSSTSGLSRR